MTVVALVLSVIALVVAVAALAKRPKPTAWPKPGDDLDAFFPTEIRLHGSGPDGAWVSEPQPVHWGRVSGGLVNGSTVRFDVIPPNTRLIGMELHPGAIPGKLDEPAGPFDFETSYTVTPTLHAPTKPTD